MEKPTFTNVKSESFNHIDIFGETLQTVIITGEFGESDIYEIKQVWDIQDNPPILKDEKFYYKSPGIIGKQKSYKHPLHSVLKNQFEQLITVNLTVWKDA